MARDFDGVDDTVLRDNADVTQADADFTACFWAFADTEGEGGAGRHFIIRNSGGTAYFGMQYASPGVNRPRFFMRFGTDIGVSGVNNDAPLSTWTHWAVRFRTSDNLLELIKDGAVLASLTADPGTTASAGQCIVGANDTGGGNTFDGRIADFRWWNSTRLSDVEVAMVMRGMVVRPNVLTVWWPLWGTTSPEPDWSGNGRHATVTGAVRIDHPPGISAYWLAPHPRRVQRVFAAGTTFFQTLPATAVGVAVFSDVVTFGKALVATAIGAATLTKGMFVTLAATALGVPALTKGMFQTLAATATGVASLTSASVIGKTLTATAVGVATLSTKLVTGVTMTATAVGVATLSAVQVLGQTLAAVATGVAGMVTEFIAGEGGGRLRRLILGDWFTRRRK